MEQSVAVALLRRQYQQQRPMLTILRCFHDPLVFLAILRPYFLYVLPLHPPRFLHQAAGVEQYCLFQLLAMVEGVLQATCACV